MRFFASLPGVGRAAQRYAVAGVERDQQHAQDARALRLDLTVLVEGVQHGVHRLARAFVDASGHGLQQQPGVLEVAAP
ncbi:hypothetical protein D3C85_1611390 [compost metagenome]